MPAHSARSSRAASPADPIVDDIRREVAVQADVLKEAKDRRNLVTKTARSHQTARDKFNSGSIAHGTANRPLGDADSGVVLDRRSYPELGPDGTGAAPNALMEDFQEWVLPRLRQVYPNATCELTKRALLFRFNETVEFDNGVRVDPTVDLVVSLDRRNAPGLWIPNRETRSWDPSHPQKHTDLFVNTEDKLRVHRARLVRLAKVAVKNDGNAKVMSSFNIEALALEIIETVGPVTAALGAFLVDAGDSIERTLTNDPADVSGPIKLPGGVTQATAAARLRFFGFTILQAAQADSPGEARRLLAHVFGPQINAIREREHKKMGQGLRLGDSGAVASVLGTTRFQKPMRSHRAY